MKILKKISETIILLIKRLWILVLGIFKFLKIVYKMIILLPEGIRYVNLILVTNNMLSKIMIFLFKYKKKLKI